MDYSKFAIEAKQPGTTNKCIVTLTGIETTDAGKTIYVFEAKVVKKGHHFPSCKVFGLHSPFIIEGATAIENPHLQPIDGHTATCRLEATSKVTPVIKVNWTEAGADPKNNQTLLLPSETGTLPTQIIKRNSDNPIEVVVCIDVFRKYEACFQAG